MNTTLLTRGLCFRLFAICAGIGFLVSLLPVSSVRFGNANRFESALKQETSFEFIAERRP
jgi:hypothetical protein